MYISLLISQTEIPELFNQPSIYTNVNYIGLAISIIELKMNVYFFFTGNEVYSTCVYYFWGKIQNCPFNFFGLT